MAIGPDGQEAMHVGMASFPHPASSRARLSAPTMVHPRRFNADFRGRLACLFHTQFPPRIGRFFPAFLAFEGHDMGAL
jgi:hypothetical protein